MCVRLAPAAMIRLRGCSASLPAPEERRARYVSELVLVSPSGAVVRGTGTLEGRIADEPRGYEGFGFDPDLRARKAKNELLPSWETNGKREHSHRANAARALLAALRETG